MIVTMAYICSLYNSGNGSVYTWGKDKHGCLGLGVERDQYFPLKVSY